MAHISIKPQAIADWLMPPLNQWVGALTKSSAPNLAQSIGIADPHTAGGAGLGLALAHALLCAAPAATGLACGHCAACDLLRAGNHTDLITLMPESMQQGFMPEKEKKPSKLIKIEQIRAISDSLFMSAQRGGRKVVVIYPAHALGDVPANALLKTLEEPPPGVYFILISEHWGQVLPTLRSRCVTTTLAAPSPAQASSWLAALGVPHAGRWLELSAGKVERAMDMAHDPLWMPLLKILPQLQHGARTDALGLAAEMSKYELKRVAEGMSLWMHDVLAISQGAPARFFAKQASGLQDLAHAIDLDLAFEFAKRLAYWRRIAEHPLNARPQTEALLLEYASLFKH